MLTYGKDIYGGGIALQKFRNFLFLLLATTGVFFFLVYRSLVAVQPIPEQALRGKQVLQQKACIECHTIFGNGGYMGGDLTKISGQISDEALITYLTNPPVLTGARKRRHIRVNEQEATALTAYFQYLHTVNTLDWPRKIRDRTMR